MDAAPETKGVSVTLQFLNRKRETVTLAAKATVEDLRALASANAPFNASTSVLLLHKGRLIPDSGYLTDHLSDGAVVTVSPSRPQPSAREVPGGLHGSGGMWDMGNDADSDADSEHGQPPRGASAEQQKLGQYLRTRLHVPDALLDVFYLLKLETWKGLLAWILAAPFFARLGLGAPYVFGSITLCIFYNLGTRAAGEPSAYSIFNDNCERLPGEMTNEQVDDAFRGRIH